MEYPWAAGRLDQLPDLAAELVRLQVEVIGTWRPGVRVAQQATGTSPIVIESTLDAVRDGVVASLVRPGGNIMGLTLIATELMGARLEMLKQAFPTISRVAFLTGPAPRASSAPARLMQEAEFPQPSSSRRTR